MSRREGVVYQIYPRSFQDSDDLGPDLLAFRRGAGTVAIGFTDESRSLDAGDPSVRCRSHSRIGAVP